MQNADSQFSQLEKNIKFENWIRLLKKLDNVPEWIITYSKDDVFQVNFKLFRRVTNKLLAHFTWKQNSHDYYPDVPPQLKWIEPRLEYHRLQPLIHFEPFSEEGWKNKIPILMILNDIEEHVKDSIVEKKQLEFSEFENAINQLTKYFEFYPTTLNQGNKYERDFSYHPNQEEDDDYDTPQYLKTLCLDIWNTSQKYNFRYIEILNDRICNIFEIIYNTIHGCDKFDDNEENYENEFKKVNIENLLISAFIPSITFILSDDNFIQTAFKFKEMYKWIIKIAIEIYDFVCIINQPLYERIFELKDKIRKEYNTNTYNEYDYIFVCDIIILINEIEEIPEEL